MSKEVVVDWEAVEEEGGAVPYSMGKKRGVRKGSGPVGQEKAEGTRLKGRKSKTRRRRPHGMIQPEDEEEKEDDEEKGMEEKAGKKMSKAGPRVRFFREEEDSRSSSPSNPMVKESRPQHPGRKTKTQTSNAKEETAMRRMEGSEVPSTSVFASSPASASSVFTGRVRVAVRVRPTLTREQLAGEALCAAVFRADNTNAHQQLTSNSAIPIWNGSKRALKETVGGPGMTLRLVKPPAMREVGTTNARRLPNNNVANSRESWWAQHLQPTTTTTHNSSSASGNQPMVKDFQFPIVLGPKASQEETYAQLQIDRYCDAAYEGKAAAVLCFGQTGSGKTFTISGCTEEEREGEDGNDGEEEDLEEEGAETARSSPPPQHRRLISEDGLQYRAITYFMGERRRLAERLGQRVRVQASYVELYNERVNDLLQGRENLKLRYHPGAQLFFVEGLMMVECESAEDVLLVLREGQMHRQRAAHRLNDDSSRSHTIFTLYVEVGGVPYASAGGGGGTAGATAHAAVAMGFDEDVDGAVAAASHAVHGKLSFVDLAGAERLKETGSGGEDTKAINKSLFALGTVIEKLSQQQREEGAAGAKYHSSRTASSFVPYRSSALTQLLMDSLSGNCELLFIACVTPLLRFYEESVKTLYYAQRSSDIATAPNARLQREEVKSYQLEERLQRLQQENQWFRECLRLPLRGAIGVEDIRRQVHLLLQQRGGGVHYPNNNNHNNNNNNAPPPTMAGPAAATMSVTTSTMAGGRHLHLQPLLRPPPPPLQNSHSHSNHTISSPSHRHGGATAARAASRQQQQKAASRQSRSGSLVPRPAMNFSSEPVVSRQATAAARLFSPNPLSVHHHHHDDDYHINDHEDLFPPQQQQQQSTHAPLRLRERRTVSADPTAARVFQRATTTSSSGVEGPTVASPGVGDWTHANTYDDDDEDAGGGGGAGAEQDHPNNDFQDNYDYAMSGEGGQRQRIVRAHHCEDVHGHAPPPPPKPHSSDAATLRPSRLRSISGATGLTGSGSSSSSPVVLPHTSTAPPLPTTTTTRTGASGVGRVLLAPSAKAAAAAAAAAVAATGAALEGGRDTGGGGGGGSGTPASSMWSSGGGGGGGTDSGTPPSPPAVGASAAPLSALDILNQLPDL